MASIAPIPSHMFISSFSTHPNPTKSRAQHSVAPDKYLVTDKFLDKVKETLENLRTVKEAI